MKTLTRSFTLLAIITGACAPVGTSTPSQETPVTTEEEAGVSSPTQAPVPTIDHSEPPPPGAESEFSTDFSKHSVSYSNILSGGPPKDGIPAVDAPKYVSISEADEWLKPIEPVVSVEVDGQGRAHPIQILMWYEIVNDTLNGQPLTVTFCRCAIPQSPSNGQLMDNFWISGQQAACNLAI